MKKKLFVSICLLAGIVIILYALYGGLYFKKTSIKQLPNIILPNMNSTVDEDSGDYGGVPEIKEETMDFQPLWEINEEVVAYINIPDTQISYPILKGASDDDYLNHNIYREESPSGELFIENFNTDQFTDPVTIVYGHNMKDGSYFGMLQNYYCDEKWFAEHKEMHVYLPDRTIQYEVKAAVPFSSLHILYYYDFSQQWIFHSFIKEIYGVRDLRANFDNPEPSGENPLLILSTCLEGNNKKRFLVLAEQMQR